MSRLFLLDSPTLPAFGIYSYSPLRADDARIYVLSAIEADSLENAVADADTARALDLILQIPLPEPVPRAYMEPGDRAIILRLLQRLPEGIPLTPADMQQIPYIMVLMERIK